MKAQRRTRRLDGLPNADEFRALLHSTLGRPSMWLETAASPMEPAFRDIVMEFFRKVPEISSSGRREAALIDELLLAMLGTPERSSS